MHQFWSRHGFHQVMLVARWHILSVYVDLMCLCESLSNQTSSACATSTAWGPHTMVCVYIRTSCFLPPATSSHLPQTISMATKPTQQVSMIRDLFMLCWLWSQSRYTGLWRKVIVVCVCVGQLMQGHQRP